MAEVGYQTPQEHLRLIMHHNYGFTSNILNSKISLSDTSLLFFVYLNFSLYYIYTKNA